MPAQEQREVRDLTRHRSTLVAERARVVTRLRKVLEDANIKLAGIASDISGLSARAMLAVPLAREHDPAALADLAQGRMRAKLGQLEQALAGRLRPHHCFLLADHAAHIDYLDGAIARSGAEVAARVAPAEEDIALLDTIPWVDRRIAEVFLAQVGADLARFPSAGHVASRAGMCPGNHESAAKRTAAAPARATSGCGRCCWSRPTARRTPRAPTCAPSTSGCWSAGATSAPWWRRPTPSWPPPATCRPGANCFDERDQHAVQRQLVRRLERLGFQVQLQPTAASGDVFRAVVVSPPAHG